MIIAEESIVSEIIEFAERENIDLIIMGTRGRTGFKNYYWEVLHQRL